jgi:hypothetical protein
LYPIFLLLFFLVASAYGAKPALALTLLMPFMAWAWVQFSEVWE